MSTAKILVADDDRNICELLKLYLEKEDYSVVLAGNGEEACPLRRGKPGPHSS